MQAVELFCGAGGFSFGMKQAGIRVVRAYDIWEPALQVYRKNMPSLKLDRVLHIEHHARQRDILARAKGAIPAIETEFNDWLLAKGIAAGQTLRNKRSHLNKARRFLKGRMLADIDLALGRLETSEGFEALAPSLKSDLRSALRLHHQWRIEVASAKRLEEERARCGGVTEAEFVAQLERDEAMQEESAPFNPKIAASLRLCRKSR